VGIAMPTKSSERWVADGNNMAEQFKSLIWGRFCQVGRVKRRPQPSLRPPLRRQVSMIRCRACRVRRVSV
jgi:hypothetical protein